MTAPVSAHHCGRISWACPHVETSRGSAGEAADGGRARAGQCKQLARFSATNNMIEAVPEALGSLRVLQILRLDGNRIAALPPAVLLGCVELHSLALRGNPVTMQALRDVEGWSAYEARRKGKMDKALDAHVHADFWEAADYERFRRH